MEFFGLFGLVEKSYEQGLGVGGSSLGRLTFFGVCP